MESVAAPMTRAGAWAFLGALAACTGAPPDVERSFVEITAEVGLEPGSGVWPDGTYFLPEIMGPGLALLDYDGDGALDLLQLRVPPPGQLDEPAANRLWRQETGGTFKDVTAEAGLTDTGFAQGVAVADTDNDGDLDLYFANYGRDRFYQNDGDGIFSEATERAGIDDELWSTAATFCDYDRDGWLDLYVVHYLRVDYRGPCRTSSGAPDYCGPATFDGVPGRLYRNDGDGSFTDVTERAGIVPAQGGKRAKGLGVVCLDLTGDALPEIFVANDGEANHLWVNQGDGTFADQAVARGVAVNRHGRAEAGMGVAVGDVDGDRWLDLLVTHLSLENNTLYLGSAKGLFMDRTVEAGMSEDDLPYTGFGCSLFDFDHDGDLDFAVVNGKVRGVLMEEVAQTGPFWERYAEPNLLFENDGAGHFENAAGRAGRFASTMGVSRGLATGDLDGDGDLDLAVSRVDNSLALYRNDVPPPGNHWLLVRARTGKRDAIGAIVRLTAGGRTRLAPILPGASYQSSSDPRAHFGLGTIDGIERIEVQWPDGRLERFPAPAVDREIELQQGSGEPAGDR